MSWTHRPGDAGASWPADELRLRWAGIVVAVKTADGCVAGTVNRVDDDTVHLDTPDGLRSIGVGGVLGFAILPNFADALVLISNCL